MSSLTSLNLCVFGLIISCLICIVYTDRLQAPRFFSQPSSSIVIENGAKFLQCQVIGYPQPVFRWLKDGDYITGYVTDPVLKIQSLRREHTGTYQCISKNSVGAIYSEPAKLVVAYMAPFEDKSERSVTIQAGQAAILEMPAQQSEPLSSISWQNEDGSELYGPKFAVTGDNSLIILSASAEDEGVYRCHATNSQVGQEDTSGPIRLVVQEAEGDEIAPRIVVGPENVQIAQGEGVTMLRCIANASPLSLLEILWYKDDVPIENAEILYTLDPWNRTLSLLNIEAGHAGSYACHAGWRNRRDVVTAQANVTVLEKPILLEKMGPETFADYGRDTHLPCKVKGFPAPELAWYKDTVDVRDLPPGKYSVQSNGTLIIKNLAMVDSGVFQCIAANLAGRISAYTWLKVKIANDTLSKPGSSSSSSATSVARVRLTDLTDLRLNNLKTNTASAPVMEVPPQNRTATVGKDETLVCKAAGSGVPNVTWFFNDSAHITSTGRFQILEDGSLLIAAVRATDAGKYTCLRSNEAGSVEGSAYLSVLVRTQIMQPPVDTRIILGHTATLQCKVSSDPSASYVLRWLRDKKVINGSRSQRIQQLDDGTLQIAEARATDVGLYECQVTSTAGDDSRAARLDVIELPYAPTTVSATKLSNSGRAVNVSWVPGFNGNNPILKYIVQRRVVPVTGPIPEPLGSWVTELSNVSSSARSVILTNLKAAAAYQFRISAINSVGEGPASEASNRVTLPQEVPSGPPVGLVGAARSSSQIMIQWNPPEEEYRNGVVMGYVVRYRLDGYGQSPWSHKNITNEAQRNYLIEDLITWKDYEIQIAAYNQVGLGSYGPSIIAKTREGVPQAAPTGVRLLALNSTSLQVWWTPPDPQLVNGINQGYKLQAIPLDGDLNRFRITVPPSPFDPLAEQTAVMTGLDKFTSYNVTVLCFTSPGDGPASVPVLAKTLEDVPNAVQNLSFHAITDRSVVVVWRPPGRSNGNLTGYTVTWSIRDSPHTLKTRNVSAEVTSLPVEHLLPTTHYTFEVFGWTRIGAGPSSVATLQSGVEPVLPEPPTHLGVSNINAFSVVLQFTPGFDGNSSIVKWTVQAQTSRNSTWYDIYEFLSPASNSTTLLVEPLIPFMEYSLRLVAHNVVGASGPSQPSQKFQTLQAPPAHPPFNMTVRAVSATELRVRWTPLQQIEWYGIPRGYNVSYRRSGVNQSSELNSIVIQDHNSNSHVLKDLEQFASYEVTVKAFNDVGMSFASPVAKERTREGVPSAGPKSVRANATSSTTVVVSWDQIPENFRNGVILGYKVYYGAANFPFKNKEVLGNTTLTTTLTELKKFTSYQIQVRAYTKMGDGTLSSVPVIAQTWEDVPGPPSNVSFPDVSLTSARVVWDVPDEANGQVLAYRVAYVMEGRNEKQSKDFTPMDRTYRVTNMEAEQFYIFEVSAQTNQGWGQVALARVYTTNSRERPQAPSAPFISSSQIQARQITFSWTPGRDGFAPLRYYTVEYREGLQAPWVTASERADPAQTSYTVHGLKPFTNYQVRLRAVNDMGPSNWSPNSEIFRTLSAPPALLVPNVKVVPITTTSVRVSWTILSESAWNGDSGTGMYLVEYRQMGEFPVLAQNSQKEEVMGVKSSYIVLDGLVRDHNYEVTVTAANSQGKGPSSPPATVFVGEAVPTGEPRNLTLVSTSPTELRLTWAAPGISEQNGDLLGYKVLYLAQGEGPEKEEMEVVPASATAHSLSFLEMYTTYSVSVLAFNPAGDGPRSIQVTATTLQGIPESPGPLQFTDITMNSLRVSWDPPRKRNGEILGYLVTYETEKNNEVDFSKQVKQKVNGTSLSVFNLEEEVRYVFSVIAVTVGYGPASAANVSTGPQPGAPGALRDLHLARTVAAVILKWENGLSGKDAVIGYYIESKKKDEDKWQPVIRTDVGVMTEYAISYQNLMPSSSYTFRVLAFNKYGVSCPVSTQEPILTPSKLYMEYGYLQQKPFYHQTWFLVTLAACSVVVITLVVATLCIKTKSQKYKSEAQKTLEESLTNDDTGFAFELRSTSKRVNSLSRSTLNRHSAMGTVMSRDTLPRGKPPPRPTPSSVPYQSDDDSGKAYDDNVDDSSLTEKPSELSSTDSNESDSEDGSQQSDPHSFVNHYANVNDTLRQSWKRQKPVKNYSSYTDSEQEGSAVMSLNGGQIVMNNMARSRAPLPGFSSFV